MKYFFKKIRRLVHTPTPLIINYSVHQEKILRQHEIPFIRSLKSYIFVFKFFIFNIVISSCVCAVGKGRIKWYRTKNNVFDNKMKGIHMHIYGQFLEINHRFAALLTVYFAIPSKFVLVVAQLFPHFIYYVVRIVESNRIYMHLKNLLFLTEIRLISNELQKCIRTHQHQRPETLASLPQYLSTPNMKKWAEKIYSKSICNGWTVKYISIIKFMWLAEPFNVKQDKMLNSRHSKNTDRMFFPPLYCVRNQRGVRSDGSSVMCGNMLDI